MGYYYYYYYLPKSSRKSRSHSYNLGANVNAIYKLETGNYDNSNYMNIVLEYFLRDTSSQGHEWILTLKLPFLSVSLEAKGVLMGWISVDQGLALAHTVIIPNVAFLKIIIIDFHAFF